MSSLPIQYTKLKIQFPCILLLKVNVLFQDKRLLLKRRTWNQGWEEPWLLHGAGVLPARGLVSLDTASDGGTEAVSQGHSCTTAQSSRLPAPPLPSERASRWPPRLSGQPSCKRNAHRPSASRGSSQGPLSSFQSLQDVFWPFPPWVLWARLLKSLCFP